jgi:membrane associated rhomboid family serine protease
MGIHDRDYLRVGQRSTSGLGNLRLVGVNTWLIVINVAVFLIANVALGNRIVRLDAGRLVRDGTSAAQISQAVVMRDVQQALPNMPGYFGQPLLDSRTGQAIGTQRVTYRPVIEAYAHFSTGKGFRELEVWRFLTFQFLHASWYHLAFNMLGLWFVGGLVEQYLGRRMYLSFYLVSGMFGAIGYLTLNFIGTMVTTYGSQASIQRVPGLLFEDQYTPLVGASAGVFGVLMASAFIAPTAIVDILGVIPARLRTAVYVFLAAAGVNLLLGGRNAGGDAAHVGGAIAGAFFIRRKHLLRDFFDLLGAPARAAGRAVRPGGGPARPSGPEDADAAELDRILQKTRDDGLSSLKDAERRELRRATDQAWRKEAKGPERGGA